MSVQKSQPKKSQLVYIIDIDKTIFDTKNSDYKNATPIKSRITRVNHLYEQGHYIIYWTARGGNSGIDWSELTKTQLELAGCKYSELRMNKPSYDIWIDDKALNSEEFFN